ncbi:MAG: nicotinate-nucleotide--dimethylbenzimidazole phosphoribosyltransferase [Bacillota bacterium]
MDLLATTLDKINSLDKKKMAQAATRLDNLTKPPGSLGKLEKLAIKLAGITGELYPQVDKRYQLVMAADHGVAAEGVSAFPQEVTTQMVKNFLAGGAAINVLAKQAQAEVKVIDVGIANQLDVEGLIDQKVRLGTANLATGPAMSRAEAVSSIEAGIEEVNQVIAKGANLVGTGEMGIGNTTPSSAILAAMTDLSLTEIVGYGSGVDESGLEKKKQAITSALEVNQIDSSDGLDVLAKVGGLEIGGMAGVMLGAAAANVPVMIDGLISGAGALIAYTLQSEVANYLIPSHKSEEPGHLKIYQILGLEPMLDLDMRLGEGTGAVLGMNLVEAATKIISQMATFAEAEVSNGE